MSFHLVALIGANALVLGFGSGLLFFVVGLVVGLLARHYRTSRLAVAQVFPLLSTFGVAYGAARWGGVFMPVQGLSPLGGAVLLWVELLLDTVAFAGLAGVSLQLMGLRVRWAALWLGAAVAAGLWWGQPGLAAALRLVAGVPAAVLGAWWLGHSGHRALAGSWMGVALTLGLETVAAPAGCVALARGLVGVMLAWALLRLLARLDNEHRERLADAARLKERHALSQMLQDGVLQHMYAVGLRLEGVQDLLDHDPERARTELAAAMVALRGAISRVREHLEDGDRRDAD